MSPFSTGSEDSFMTISYNIPDAGDMEDFPDPPLVDPLTEAANAHMAALAKAEKAEKERAEQQTIVDGQERQSLPQVFFWPLIPHNKKIQQESSC